jgi:hypothetical protein
MSQKLSVSLPDELRQEILDCKAWMQEQLQKSENAIGAQGGKIREMEGIIGELETRAAVLHPQIITSDTAASELLVVESRLTAARSALENLHSAATDAGRLDLIPAHHLLDRICAYWRVQLPILIQRQMAPFQMPDHLLMPMAAHAGAFNALRMFRDYPPKYAHGLDEVFDRALRDQVNLGYDDPAQASAPPAQPDPAAVAAQPS